MKNIFKLVFAACSILTLASCHKVADLPLYGTGTKPTLAASNTNIAPLAADSTKTALALSWTDALHATSAANVKYTIEIDSANKNFSNPLVKTVTGALSTTFTGKELNTYLLSRGYAINSTVSLDVRVTSSYANNNEKLSTDILRIKYTIYKVPPRVALPTTSRLYLVGDASQGGWNNPVPVPSQEFARLDETTWAGIFNLVGGKQYLVLPLNGDWGNKYSVANNTVAGLSAGGDFGFNLNDNFPGPATSGFYKIVLDFQSGKFTVTPYTSVLPTNLFIVGDATAGGWNNPVPVPSQQFTRINSSVWELTIPLVGGKEFLVLPENGNWSKKYALNDNGVAGISAGGEFGYHQDGQPAPDIFNANFKSPATSGTYKITLNFAAPTTIAGASGRFTIQ